MGGRYQPDPAKWELASWEAKMKARVCYEWQHVTIGPQKRKHIVSVQVKKLLNHSQKPSRVPVSTRVSDLHFSIEWLDAFADCKLPESSYGGIAYENDEREEIVRHLPNCPYGQDMREVEVYWNLACGRTICCSVMDFFKMQPDELVEQGSAEAYVLIASEFNFINLGIVDGEEPELQFDDFRADLGTLAGKRWCRVTWSMPRKETDPCWWITNATETDATLPPKLLFRSLASLRLELEHLRMATTSKVRSEWEFRRKLNSEAADVIHTNENIWRMVDGPRPESLYEPSTGTLAAVRDACERLEELVETNKDSHDGLGVYGEETLRAAQSLVSLEWQAIWRERFHVTPYEAFKGIVGNVENQINRDAAEAKRRLEWLAGVDEEVAGGAGVPASGGRTDKFGVDLDRFSELGRNKPHDWQRAVRIAGWVLVDEMRTLLELHYDEVHYEKYRALGKKARGRQSAYKVFNSVAQAHRRKQCQRIVLPEALKAILRSEGKSA